MRFHAYAHVFGLIPQCLIQRRKDKIMNGIRCTDGERKIFRAIPQAVCILHQIFPTARNDEEFLAVLCQNEILQAAAAVDEIHADLTLKLKDAVTQR